MEINAETVPSDPTHVELGVLVDRSDVEKGWTPLSPRSGNATKAGGGKKASQDTLLLAGLDNGHLVAFRFRDPSDASEAGGADTDSQDPGWDVVIPSFDDEEEE